MDAMTDPRVEKITIKKSARVGYTLMITNLIGYTIHNDPKNILMVQPTIEDAQGYSKEQLKSMLTNTPVLEGLAPEFKTRDSRNTILRKEFPGMTLYVVGANSGRGLRRVSAPVQILDEYSAFPPSAGNEGEQSELAAMRGAYFWNSKLILGSTPLLDGDRICESYDASDKRQYHVPCPFCKHEQTWEWSQFDFSKHGTVKNPVYICIKCEKAIEFKHHRWMMEHGRWIAEKPFDGHAGFYLWAAHSYSPKATWHHIVKGFLDKKDNPEKFRVYVNTVWGQGWAESGEKLDYIEIMQQAEDYPAEMPAGAAYLTAAVDVQNDRLEVLIVAWGLDEESWCLEHIVILGSPGMEETWERLDTLLQKTYQHPGGNRVHIHCTCIDTGGRYTDESYRFIKPREVRGLVAIKGDNQIGKPLVNRPSKKTKKRQVQLIMVGVNTGKDTVFVRLRATTSRGRIHFPTRFSERFFEQICNEKKTPKWIRGRQYQVWEIISRGTGNEGWDLLIYNFAAIRILFPDTTMLNYYTNRFLTAKPPPEEKVDNSLRPKKQSHSSKGGFVNRWKD